MRATLLTPALRLLWRDRRMVLAIILSVGLGVGVNLTLFSLINAVLLHPLPLRDADSLVTFQTHEERQARRITLEGVSWPNFLDIRNRAKAFDGVVAASLLPIVVTAEHREPQEVIGALVSDDYFQVLGAPLTLGRGFDTSAAQVIISHGLWQRLFGGDASVLGARLVVNGRPMAIGGVAGRGFRGIATIGGPEIWAPASAAHELAGRMLRDAMQSRRGVSFSAHARIKAGVTLEQASDEVDALSRGLVEQYPDNAGRSLALVSAQESVLPAIVRRQLTTISVVFSILAGLVLAVAYTNVSGLLLTRASAQQADCSIRLALGASNWAIMSRFVLEGVVLAGLSSAAAMLFSRWATTTLWSLRPVFVPDTALQLSVDSRVVLVMAGMLIASALVFSVVPAVSVLRRPVANLLKVGGVYTSTNGSQRIRRLLVGAQALVSMVILFASGLLISDLLQRQRVDTGFNAADLVTFGLGPETQGMNEAQGRLLYDQVARTLAALPQIESVTLSSALPLLSAGTPRMVVPPGADPADQRSHVMALSASVVPNYFQVSGIRLKYGRAFTDADHGAATPVAIINTAMADRFGLANPLGTQARLTSNQLFEIVGVVETIKYNGLSETDTPFLYLPLAQQYFPRMIVQARVRATIEAASTAIREAMRTLDPNLALVNFGSYDQVIDMALWAPKMGARLVTFAGVLVLVLIGTGIYGLVCYSISLRERELGIRRALGARDTHLCVGQIRGTIQTVATGAVLGIPAALALGRALSSFLPGVPAVAWTAVLGSGIALMIFATIAAYPAARRATRAPLPR